MSFYYSLLAFVNGISFHPSHIIVTSPPACTSSEEGMDCDHLNCQSTGPAEDEEGVKTCEDVPVDGEDGGEVVEDDPGGEDAKNTADDGQVCVHLHPTGGLLKQCF